MGDLPDVSVEDERSIRRFVALEARLADASSYDAWEALWSHNPRCQYLVPAGRTDVSGVAYINDNRSRIASRVKQWKTGRRYAGEPASRLARVVGDLTITRDGEAFHASASFVLAQHRETVTVWAGTAHYELERTSDDKWALKTKVIDLINSEGPIPTLAFIL